MKGPKLILVKLDDKDITDYMMSFMEKIMIGTINYGNIVIFLKKI